MSATGVSGLDQSIDKANAWLGEVADDFGTHDRHFAYRVTRAWLHTLRDRLPVPVAAHFAAQLPELLRGVFYDGWKPSRVPVKYDQAEYIHRFAHDARIRDTDVPHAASLVSRTVRRHVSGAPSTRHSTCYPPGSASSPSPGTPGSRLEPERQGSGDKRLRGIGNKRLCSIGRRA